MPSLPRIHLIKKTGLLRGSELSLILRNFCTDAVDQANFIIEFLSLKASDNLLFGLLKVLGVNCDIEASSWLCGLQRSSLSCLLGNICI